MVPSDETNITEKIEATLKQARDLDGRIYDLALVPVRELPQRGGQAAEEQKSG